MFELLVYRNHYHKHFWADGDGALALCMLGINVPKQTGKSFGHTHPVLNPC